VNTSLWAVSAENPFFHVPFHSNMRGNYVTDAELVAYHTSRMRRLEEWRPEIVALGCRWESYNEENFTEFIRFVAEHAKYVVLVESPPPLAGVGDRNFAEFASFLRVTTHPGSMLHWQKLDYDELVATRRKLIAITTHFKNVYLLPLADLYLDEYGVIAGKGKVAYYLDDDHLTDEGAVVSYDRISVAIHNLFENNPGKFPLVGPNMDSAERTLRITELVRPK
jgi:hypothetical protein